jgi:hypothetical protein
LSRRKDLTGASAAMTELDNQVGKIDYRSLVQEHVAREARREAA